MKSILSLTLLIFSTCISLAQERQFDLVFRAANLPIYALDVTQNNYVRPLEIENAPAYEIGLRISNYVDGVRNHWNWSSFELSFVSINSVVTDPLGVHGEVYGFVRSPNYYILNTHSSLLSTYYRPSYKRKIIATKYGQFSMQVSAITGTRTRVAFTALNKIDARSYNGPITYEDIEIGSGANTVSWINGLDLALEYSWRTNRDQQASISLSWPYLVERIWWTNGSKQAATVQSTTYGQITLGYAF